MTSIKLMREYWDKLVPEYDLNNHRKWFWSSPDAWADEIARRISDCQKVLDIGCGAGALSIPLSRKFDLYSLDFSRDMLTLLKTRKNELGTEIEMINADAHNIPFKDESFDAVICRFAIWPLSNPEDAIEEIVRASKKKVVIIEGDWSKNEKPTLQQKVIGKSFYTIYDSYYKLATGRNPKKHFKEMRKYHQISTSCEKIKQWLENSGVIITEVDYSFKDRISTKKSKFLQAITGFNEPMFILSGEKA